MAVAAWSDQPGAIEQSAPRMGASFNSFAARSLNPATHCGSINLVKRLLLMRAVDRVMIQYTRMAKNGAMYGMKTVNITRSGSVIGIRPC